MLTIRQLECFRAVMATGKMVTAARDMRISQPAVSKIIDDLEYELGIKLFERRRGHIEPTPEARILLSDVVSGIAGIQKITRTAKEINQDKRGSLVLVGISSVAINAIPLAVAELLKLSPDITVRIISRSIPRLDEMLAAKNFDLAVMKAPVSHPGVVAEPIDLRCVCALPQNHPLTKKSVIRTGDLDGEPFIAFTEEQELSGIISRFFSAANARLNVVAETQISATGATLVRSGVGIGIMDPMTAAAHAGNGLVVRPFEPSVDLNLALVRPLDREPSQLLTKFTQLLKVQMRAVP